MTVLHGSPVSYSGFLRRVAIIDIVLGRHLRPNKLVQFFISEPPLIADLEPVYFTRFEKRKHTVSFNAEIVTRLLKCVDNH